MLSRDAGNSSGSISKIQRILLKESSDIVQ